MSDRSRQAPLPPGTRPIAEAIGANDTLADLGRRLRESNERLKALSALLPGPMRAGVQAGPLDEEGWTLLASNNAVSVKLRQMRPALEAHLRQRGFADRPLRIKVLSR
jgi:hypothetical protein